MRSAEPSVESVDDLVAGRGVLSSAHSTHNRVLILAGPLGLRVLKIYTDRGRFANELAALRVLATAGIPAPEVFRTARLRGARCWAIELEHLPGTVSPARAAGALRGHLALLASARGDGVGSVHEVRRGLGGPRWSAFVAAKLDGYATALAALRSAEVGAALDTARAGLARAEPPVFSLVHADISAGNLRLRADGTPMLIDWELGRWGDALYDIALMRHRNLLAEDAEAIALYRSLALPARGAAAVRDCLDCYRNLLRLRDLARVEQSPHPSLVALRQRVRRDFGLPAPEPEMGGPNGRTGASAQTQVASAGPNRTGAGH